MSLEMTWQGNAADMDDRLAGRCRNGDSAAFDELVLRYQLRMFRFAYRVLQDRTEAEDAVQDTFIRAFRALPSYRPEGYFSSWIYRIALNECRRRLRGRHITIPLDLVEHLCGTNDPQAHVMTNDRNRMLRETVDRMPETYRLVLVLFYFEELSVDEISRTMGLSNSAVKVRLHRGRGKLLAQMEPTW